MVKCKICGSNNIEVIYSGRIRNGAPGRMTEENVPVYRCCSCECFWHEPVMNTSLYTSDTYRESMDENVTLPDFYQKHDAEILDKLKYTGTSIYRDKRFMDIGCGGGGYADFVRGVASQVVLVEPNENFTALLRDKDYEVFSYAEDAIDKYKSTIDLITSYDVIEHVDDPKEFLQTIYRLLRENGKAFIGTPTEYPVLRNLLGAEFDAFVFSVQHPWVFSSRSLELLAKKCGFSTFKVKFYQRFGIGNLVAWLQLHKSCGEAVYDFITPALNSLYKIEMAREETAEYLILELGK